MAASGVVQTLSEKAIAILRIAEPALPKLTYGFIVCVLSSILWWGHHTHWDLSFGMAGHGHAPHITQVSTGGGAHAVSPEEDSPLAMDESSMQRSGIELGTISRESMPLTITANGIVSYNQNLRAQLSSRVRGHVWRVERHVGDMVRKGEVLAIVDASDVGTAKGEVLQALVQAELATTTYENLKNLGAAVRGRQIREAEVAARDANIRTQVCVQALANMGLPVKLEDLISLNDEERARHLQFLGLPSHITAALEPNSTSSLVPLVAPFDAMVIGRDLALGEVVSPEQPQIEIADIRKVWVLLEVRKEDVNLIRLGQKLDFAPDGMAVSVSGKVDWISSSLDEKTRTLQVRAEVENPCVDAMADEPRANHLLRANTYGTGKICVRANDEALVAPTAAVQFDGQKHFVFVRRGEIFDQVPVEIGVTDSLRTEILSGVQAGDVIATVGSHVLKAELQLAVVAD